MLSSLLLLVVASLNTPPGAAADLLKGSALYGSCQAELRVMSLPSPTKASQSDLLNGTFCIGYLNGYTAESARETPICTNGAPIGALVQIYISYMDQNPDLMKADRGIGLKLALQDAYPCAVSQPEASASHLAKSTS